MYFTRFPKTFYTLDNLESAQLVTSIFVRVVFSEEIKNNLSVFDEYDIKDGETPEILADILYDDPQLHWVILHLNEVLDPRFEWPLSTTNLNSVAEDKYSNVKAIHHYENSNGFITNGNIYINSSAQFANLNLGNVIVNNTNVGVGVVTSVENSSNVRVMVSEGGFQTGDRIYISDNTSYQANITSTTVLNGIPITNLSYESELNEAKRRIKILKPQYIDAIIAEFNKKLENING